MKVLFCKHSSKDFDHNYVYFPLPYICMYLILFPNMNQIKSYQCIYSCNKILKVAINLNFKCYIKHLLHRIFHTIYISTIINLP